MALTETTLSAIESTQKEEVGRKNSYTLEKVVSVVCKEEFYTQWESL